MSGGQGHGSERVLYGGGKPQKIYIVIITDDIVVGNGRVMALGEGFIKFELSISVSQEFKVLPTFTGLAIRKTHL